MIGTSTGLALGAWAMLHSRTVFGRATVDMATIANLIRGRRNPVKLELEVAHAGSRRQELSTRTKVCNVRPRSKTGRSSSQMQKVRTQTFQVGKSELVENLPLFHLQNDHPAHPLQQRLQCLLQLPQNQLILYLTRRLLDEYVGKLMLTTSRRRRTMSYVNL